MRIIRGSAGSGKTALVLREFKETLSGRIVVPTATLVRHLQHELAREGAVFSPACITSLHRFYEECAPDIQVVPDALLRAVVRDCLHVAKMQASDGMVSTVIETIELFENQARKLPKTLTRLWQSVEGTVSQRGYHTRRGLIEAAARNLKPGMRIWMDGFLNFSALESAFVTAAARTCKLTLTVNNDDLHKLGLRLGAEDVLLPGRLRRSETFVVEARTVEREVDEIAHRIIAADVPFRRIAVALRDQSYLSLLQAAFERFGIPGRFYFTQPLKSHPASIFLSGLISGALNNWDFEAALTTLRAHPRWGHMADFDRFDFAVREAMPGRGADSLLSLCESEWLREAISRCLVTDTWKTTATTPAGWQQRLEGLAADLYRPGVVDGDLMAARSHVAALTAWLGAIESIAAYWHDSAKSIRLEEYWRVASTAIDTATFQIPDDRANVVHVMNVYEARQWDVAALFICGMTDREFPKRRPPNLLVPELTPELAAIGDHDERTMFTALCSRASEQLILSYPTHDSNDKSLARSRFLDDFPDAEPAQRVWPETAPLQQPGRAELITAPALLAQIAGLHKSVSLTGLEDLAQCRFKFFSGRTLGLKGPPERPGERLQPRVTGSILHEALEHWQKNLDRDFVELFEEAFDSACRKHKLPPGYRLEVERIEFRQIAMKVKATEKWKSDSSEVEVELGLDLPFGITAKCRIDRIDRFGSDCAIIDYKSSKTANVERLVESNSKLQGPLYALAVRQKLDLRPVAMAYWSVREDKLHGWGHIPGASFKLLEMPADWAIAARDRIVTRLDSFLHGGEVTAVPTETAECRWCDFKGACRKDERAAFIQIAGGNE